MSQKFWATFDVDPLQLELLRFPWKMGCCPLPVSPHRRWVTQNPQGPSGSFRSPIPFLSHGIAPSQFQGPPESAPAPNSWPPAGLLEGSHLREVPGLKPRRSWAPRMTTTTQGCRPHTGVSSRLWAPKAELQLGRRPHKASLGTMTYGGFRLPMTELGLECLCSPSPKSHDIWNT